MLFVAVEFAAVQAFLTHAGGCNGNIESFTHYGALDAPKPGFAAQDNVRRNAPLTIGNASQREETPVAAHEISYLHCIADCPYSLVARVHVIIDANAAQLSYLQTGLPGKRNLRADSYGKQDHIAYISAS